jgi:purine nucleoside phosphorylase
MGSLSETFEGLLLDLFPIVSHYYKTKLETTCILICGSGPVNIAIIGGTGLTSLPHFEIIAELPLTHPSLQTPWGSPSSPITILSHPRKDAPPLNVAFISRHGLHHEFAPHEVNSRANIAALRKIGVRSVVAFSAVGSLKEEVRPRDFLIPDQVVDRTKGVSSHSLSRRNTPSQTIILIKKKLKKGSTMDILRIRRSLPRPLRRPFRQ